LSEISPSPALRLLASSTWRRARLSGSTGGNCVEVAAPGGTRLRIRDSKDPDGPRLTPTVSGWNTWLGLVNSGHYDLDRLDTRPTLTPYLTVWLADNLIHLRDPCVPADTLRFTSSEWHAFLDGAAHGEFAVDPTTGRFALAEPGDIRRPVLPAQRRAPYE
jgi:hypothetical protein